MLSGLTNYLPETALTVFDNLEFFIRHRAGGDTGRTGGPGAQQAPEGGGRAHPLHHRLHLGPVHDPVQVRLCGPRRRGRPAGADPARIAAQVVSGISFLGAGVIFQKRQLHPRPYHRRRYEGHRRRRHGHRRGHVLGRAYRGRRTGGHPDRAPPLPRGGRRPDDPGDRGGNDGQR